MGRGDQDLVPRNLPYGGRQAYVAAARQAGVPLSSRPGPRRGPVGFNAAQEPELVPPDLDVLQHANPEEIPGFDLSPQGQEARLMADMEWLAVSSANPLVRGTAALWLERRRASQPPPPL
jgi:hypothetical protein